MMINYYNRETKEYTTDHAAAVDWNRNGIEVDLIDSETGEVKTTWLKPEYMEEEKEGTTMNMEDIKAAILNYFKENEEEYNEVIEDLDSYNGYLNDDRYYSMMDLDELYAGTDPTEILNRAFYGYDEESYITDSYGRKEHQAFNPNREYFRFNGYGNLVSADYKDYSSYLDNYFVDEVIENASNLYSLPEEVEKLIDMLNDISTCEEFEEAEAEAEQTA